MIRRTPTGYSVDVPDLPGCVATGTTVEHARQMIAQAIEMHLELMLRSGKTPPSPTRRIEFEVDDASGEELCTWVEVETPSAEFWHMIEQRRSEPTIPWDQAKRELT